MSTFRWRAINLSFLAFWLPIRGWGQSTPVAVDWPTRSAACAAKATQPTTQQFKATGINDLAFDFATGAPPHYVLSVTGTPASQVPPADVLGLFLGQQQAAAAQNAARSRGRAQTCVYPDEPSVAADLAAVRTSGLTVSPRNGNGDAASLEESRTEAWSVVAASNELTKLQHAYADASCASILAGEKNDPTLQWLARLNSNGEHTASFTVNVNPNTNYKFELAEKWNGKSLPNADLTWRCGETDILSLSVGPLFTTLPYRTYSHQKAPVPPGSSTTLDVLGVSETSNILGAALLNIHIPQIPTLPDWVGLSVSVGPVYTLGNAPSVSKLGFFTGGSLHLYRSFYLTPGVHIGPFADFPLNFANGTPIPANFGELTPVTRNTVHFAVGVTFKTNTFKSSSQNPAPANTTPQNQPAAPAQPQPAQPAPPGPAAQPTTNLPSGQPQPAPIATPAPTPKASKANWTVLVYMNAKNNLECDALDNFAGMADIGSTAAVQVIAELGRPQHDYGCGDNKWVGVYRFHVEKGNGPLLRNAIQEPGLPTNADMGSGETLADFVSWGKQSYPADHYLLIIWNHGQGWRFQTALRQEIKTAAASGRGSRFAAPENLGNQRSQVGGFKSVSFDDDTGHFLYNSDVADSLAKVLGSSKIDVLGFDACLMAMIETGYAMKSVANMLVGSEELEPGAGWKYDDFLAGMNAGAPALNADGVAKLLVASYKKQYGDINRTTLSAIALDNIREVSNAVSRFADQLSANLATENKSIAQARSACKSYGSQAPIPMRNPIDLTFFAKNLLNQTKSATLQAAATDVINKVKSAVIATYASARLNTQAGYGSYGLSIYFPATKTDFNDDKPDNNGYLKGNDDHPVQFVKQGDIHWADFVYSYLGCKGAAGQVVCQ
jgi:hypothetical protein